MINGPLPHYGIFCLHLVKGRSFSALLAWCLLHYTKYLSCFSTSLVSPLFWHLILPLFFSCASLSLSNLLPAWLSLFLFQSIPPPCLPTHFYFSLPPSSSVCVSFSLRSPPLSILFMCLRWIRDRVKKIIPRFSAARQQAKIEKVTFHVQF